jgi:hypothetical protein
MRPWGSRIWGAAWVRFATDSVSRSIAVTVCGGCGVREARAAEALAEEADAPLLYGVRAGQTAAETMAALASSHSSVEVGHECAGRLRVS